MASHDDVLMQVTRSQDSVDTLGASSQTFYDGSSTSSLPLYTPTDLNDSCKIGLDKTLSMCSGWNDSDSEPESTCEDAVEDTSLDYLLDAQLRDNPLDAFAELCWGLGEQRGRGWEWWDDDEDNSVENTHEEPADVSTPETEETCTTVDDVAKTLASDEDALKARFRRPWARANDPLVHIRKPLSPFEHYDPPFCTYARDEGVGHFPMPASYVRQQRRPDAEHLRGFSLQRPQGRRLFELLVAKAHRLFGDIESR